MAPPSRGGAARGARGRGRGAPGGRGRGRGPSRPHSPMFLYRGRGTDLPAFLGGKKGDDAGRKPKSLKRRRPGQGKPEDSEDEDRETKGGKQRMRHDREEGDSSDDDVMNPEDSDFEDEELDEDEAFNSSDEEKYGALFTTFAKREKSAKRKASADIDNENESDSENGALDYDNSMHGSSDEGGADMEEGGALLSDMLSGNAYAESNTKTSKKGVSKAGSSTKKARTVSEESPEEQSGEGSGESSGEEHGEERSDVEVEDDDVRDEESSEESSDEEPVSGDHDKLLDFVSGLEDREQAKKRRRESGALQQQANASEFGAAWDAGGVSLEMLMGELGDTPGFSGVRRKVEQFASKAKAPAAPTAKAVEDRAEREVAYSTSQKDMKKWVAPVQANRTAEVLNFKPGMGPILSSAALVAKFQPQPGMEADIANLLKGSGADEDTMAAAEEKGLEAKEYTAEEVAERQSELQRMRALLFYHERKRHHINKIKSKLYRKIRKKAAARLTEEEREMLKEIDPIAAAEQEAKEERKRAEERVSLRHESSSRWVKGALMRGAADDATKEAIKEQLQLKNELRQRQEAESDNSDNSGSESDTGNSKSSTRMSRKDTALLDTLGTSEDADLEGRGKGIFKMAFMQRNMDAQVERAKKEKDELLRELAEGALESSDDDQRAQKAKKSVKKAKMPKATAKDRAAISKTLPDGSQQATGISMDARVRSSVSGAITIDLGNTEKSTQKSAKKPEDTSVNSNKKQKKQGKKQDSIEDLWEIDSGNPWLIDSGDTKMGESSAPLELEQTSNVEKGKKKRKKDKTVSENPNPSSNPSRNGFGNGFDHGLDSVLRGDADEENPWLDSTMRSKARSTHDTDSSSKKRKRKSQEAGLLVSVEDTVAAVSAHSEKNTQKNTGKKGEIPDVSSKDAPAHSEKSASKSNKKKNKGNKSDNTDSTSGALEATIAPGDAKEGSNPSSNPRSNPRSNHVVDDNGDSTIDPLTLTQEQLVARAFATPDMEAEFAAQKEDEMDFDASLLQGKKGKNNLVIKAGWGSWVGMGVQERKPSPKEIAAKAAQAAVIDAAKKARKDASLPTVILNEKRQKSGAKLKVAQVPYPFTSKEQYERSMRQPLGREWNTTQSLRDLTKRDVLLKAGTIIDPMKLPKQLAKKSAKNHGPKAKLSGGF